MTSTSSQPTTPFLPTPQPFDVLVTLNTLLHRLVADPLSSEDHGTQLNGRVAALAIKDFPTEAIKVKNTLTEARRALQSLPDIEKSLAQQEIEIRKLETAIKRKKQMVRRMGAAGAVEGNGEEMELGD